MEIGGKMAGLSVVPASLKLPSRLEFVHPVNGTWLYSVQYCSGQLAG